MKSFEEHIRELCALEGISGREDAVRGYLIDELKASPADMEWETDALGNLLVQVKGKHRAGCRLLFAAHMDEVGMLVTGATQEGYLRVTAVGGIDPRILFGKRVRVNGHPGVIGGKAVHHCTSEEKTAAPSLDEIRVDILASGREQALEWAPPGSPVVWDSVYTPLSGGYFKARALDDRAGCALLLELVRDIPERDFLLAFTVQEEIGLRGAKTAAFALEPDMAVVVDATTAADTVGVPSDKQVCRAGGGPVVSFMDGRTLYDRPLYELIRSLADQEGIPNQTKTLVAGGNDAGAIQSSRGGVRVAAISLPCRYLHSPACVLQEEDCRATAKLLKLLADGLCCGADGPR